MEGSEQGAMISFLSLPPSPCLPTASFWPEWLCPGLRRNILTLDLRLKGHLGDLESKPQDVKGVGPILVIRPQKRRAVLAKLRPPKSAWCPVPPAQDTGASYDFESSDGCVYLSVTWKNENLYCLRPWVGSLSCVF